MSQKIAIALICFGISTLCLGMSRVSQQSSRYFDKYVRGALNKFYPRTKGSPKPLSTEQGIAKLENKDNMLKDRWLALDREYANQERILANAESRYAKVSVLDRLFPALQKRRREIAMRDMQSAKNSMQVLQQQGAVVKDQASTLKKQISTALGKDVSIERGVATLENKDYTLKSTWNKLDREYANQDRILANAENRYEKVSIFDRLFPSWQKRRREIAVRDMQDAKNSMKLLQQKGQVVKDQSATLKKQVNTALEQ